MAGSPPLRLLSSKRASSGVRLPAKLELADCVDLLLATFLAEGICPPERIKVSSCCQPSRILPIKDSASQGLKRALDGP